MSCNCRAISTPPGNRGPSPIGEQFGRHIGSPSKSSALPPRHQPPGNARREHPVGGCAECYAMRDEIVLQRLDLPEGQKFDLIVATNMYRSTTTSSNRAWLWPISPAMLQPGGFRRRIPGLVEFPGSLLNAVDYLKVDYWNDRPEVREHIVWYRRGSDAEAHPERALSNNERRGNQGRPTPRSPISPQSLQYFTGPQNRGSSETPPISCSCACSNLFCGRSKTPYLPRKPAAFRLPASFRCWQCQHPPFS